jgi:hypothetical protein
MLCTWARVAIRGVSTIQPNREKPRQDRYTPLLTSTVSSLRITTQNFLLVLLFRTPRTPTSSQKQCVFGDELVTSFYGGSLTFTRRADFGTAHSCRLVSVTPESETVCRKETVLNHFRRGVVQQVCSGTFRMLISNAVFWNAESD